MSRARAFGLSGRFLFLLFCEKSCPVCLLRKANEAGLFILKFHVKNYFAFFLLLAASLFFYGCKTETVKDHTSVNTREITDDLGRRVMLPAKVERAVSLAPNLTEIAFAVDAGERLVGVTTYCNYPPEAQKNQKIGDTINPNLETIIALKPQIVLVSTDSQIEAFTKTLENQNIGVFVTNPQNVDGVYKSIFQFGEIFGKSERANEVIEELKRRVTSVEAKTANARRVKVFVQISKDPLYTIGKTSFITDLINRAGGVSVTETIEKAYQVFSKETALALQPEAIILSDSEDNREPNDVFKNSPAIKNGRVYRINADILSRAGPRLVDALEQIAKDLHPESFQ
jgi:iron complex transport system substrate-binding protein